MRLREFIKSWHCGGGLAARRVCAATERIKAAVIARLPGAAGIASRRCARTVLCSDQVEAQFQFAGYYAALEQGFLS